VSISSIGSNTAGTDALQKQLKADQKTLTQDEAKKASQATLEADQAKVMADQQAIQSAQEKAKTAEQTGHGHGVDAKAAPSTASDVASTSTSPSSTGGVDISV
jgi:hypothetical protein